MVQICKAALTLSDLFGGRGATGIVRFFLHTKGCQKNHLTSFRNSSFNVDSCDLFLRAKARSEIVWHLIFVVGNTNQNRTIFYFFVLQQRAPTQFAVPSFLSIVCILFRILWKNRTPFLYFFC